MSDITIRQLLEAGCHFGHQTRYWCPRMEPYIFGERNKLHILDLEQTLPMFKEALNYLGSVAAEGGKVLFVGTKRQASKLVEQEAKRCNSPYVNFRWLGGMLTNYKTIRKSVNRLKEMDKMVENGELNKLVKKEALQFNRERAKLEKSLAGIKDMNGLPDVLFVIDREYDYIAVNEANKLGIPVVSIVDSNCSPVGIDYVIPGNDDAIRSIRLYLSAVADTINDSRLAALTSQAASLHAAADEEEEVAIEDVAARLEEVIDEKAAAAEAPEAEEAPAEQAEAPKKVAKKKVVVKNEEAAAADDDLTQINGIGPVIATKLEAMGITTVAQIAELTAERIAEIDEELNFKGRIDREEWVAQAKQKLS